jgi:thiosulfate dehydrogenase [quinone] large subunit
MVGQNHALGLRAADISLAYGLLRIVVGINYFNHGFTRLGNIPGFMDAMVGAMDGAWMPEPLVRFTAFFVSPVELIFGLFLIVGLFTRLSLIVLFVLMAILMYGVTVVQNWDSASSQLIYNIVLFILLAGVGYNRWALDNVWFRRDRSSVEPPADPAPTGVMRFGRGPQDVTNRQRKYRISAFWLKG